MKLIKTILLLAFSFSTSIAMGGQIHTTLDVIGSIRITIPETSIHYQIGASVAGINDFDHDGFLDAAIGAPKYEPQGFGNDYGNGAVFIVPGHQLNRDQGEIDLSSPEFEGVVVMGRMGSEIGHMVAGAGNVNADNCYDLAFGSEKQSTGYILFGSENPRRLIPVADLKNDGVEITKTGFCVSPGGDVNGDGFPDVIFSNPYSESKTVQGKDYFLGRVCVIFGRTRFPSIINSLNFDDFLIPYYNPMTLGSEVGYSICGGFDWDIDGLSDYFIVAPKGGRDRSGRAILIQGQKTISLDEEPSVLLTIAHAKYYVHNAGDVNADGYTDFLVGADGNKTILLWGGSYPRETAIDLEKFDSAYGTTIEGAQSAYGVGDFNGDHIPDIAVAMPSSYVADKAMAGRVVFICGRPDMPKTIDIDRLCNGEETHLDYIVVDGVETYGMFGASVAGLGDLQGNGFGDVIVGAPSSISLSDEIRRDRPGTAYVIQGRSLFECLHDHRSLFPVQSQTKQTASEKKTVN